MQSPGLSCYLRLPCYKIVCNRRFDNKSSIKYNGRQLLQKQCKNEGNSEVFWIWTYTFSKKNFAEWLILRNFLHVSIKSHLTIQMYFWYLHLLKYKRFIGCLLFLNQSPRFQLLQAHSHISRHIHHIVLLSIIFCINYIRLPYPLSEFFHKFP